MGLNIVTSLYERNALRKMLNAHGDYVIGKISRDDWEKYPREIWIDWSGNSECPFVVYDNSSGMCFVEEFKSIDGAILFASCPGLSCEDSSQWDYAGSLNNKEMFDF